MYGASKLSKPDSIIASIGGLKCPRKIHFNTQCTLLQQPCIATAVFCVIGEIEKYVKLDCIDHPILCSGFTNCTFTKKRIVKLIRLISKLSFLCCFEDVKDFYQKSVESTLQNDKLQDQMNNTQVPSSN